MTKTPAELAKEQQARREAIVLSQGGVHAADQWAPSTPVTKQNPAK